MNLMKKAKWMASIGFAAAFIALAGGTAYAANDTAGTLEELQSKVDTAMHERPATYSVDYSGSGLTSAAISSLIQEVFEADDYLHYSTKTYSFSASGTSGATTVKFNFTYWESKAQADYVKNTVQQTLNTILTEGMNDFQKQKAIHDWIELNLAYDTTKKQHSAYAGLTSPYKTVCQGYALLAFRMLTDAGIENRIVEGKAGGELHTWNLVKLDGKWYHFDTTWDDPLPDVTGRVIYDYYNLTDDQISQDHTWERADYPAANSEFDQTLTAKIADDPSNASIYQGIYDALGFEYSKAELTASNQAELSAFVQQAIQNQEEGIKIRYTNKAALAADVTAVMKGTSNITSYSYSYSSYTRTTSSTDIVLNLKFTYNIPIPVQSVALSKNALDLKIGGTGPLISSTLLATVAPANASTKSVTWSSSDTSVATVAGGVVKAIGPGTATITATTVDGGKTATATVTVKKGVTGVTLSAKSLTVKAGGPDQTLVANVLPVDASDKIVTWTSSNTSIATVDADGIVHAVAPGTATITATTKDGAKTSKTTVTVPINVSGVSLDKSDLTLAVGSKGVTVKATIAPLKAADKSIIWTSSDTSIATVSKTGLVSPVAEGSATVTAATYDGGFKATVNVKVIIAVTKVTLDKSKLTVKVGYPDEKLTASINPGDASDKDVTWTSSNTSVATVDADGNVHAIAPGTATVTATSKQDSKKFAKATVTVPVNVSGITLNTSSATLSVGKKTLALKSTIAPAKATVKTVKWTSSDASVASVSSTGIVTPLKEGSATITATTDDGSFTASAAITVIVAVDSVKVGTSAVTLTIGDSYSAQTVSINPGYATVTAVTYTSSNLAVVTVDADGRLEAVSPGTATITVKSVQDGSKTAKYTVKVLPKASGVKLSVTTLKIKSGGKAVVLKAVIAPTNTALKTVQWTSSDDSVATVDDKGAVTPVGAGTATITVTTDDGGFIATCTVTVT
ncbi:Ig-like domain-containing protein [Cohnella faecalis]|uniref:Transglutaminase n=1 Tax=Cohnella faecalis TaxID=2315694 RepID=A0A398CU95_9BACL|nr:Ig-like domain-containing protein [Cohnella faecalis]RIE04268.1 hypothetical protein D3H35_06535 [Cohnella faecalis]